MTGSDDRFSAAGIRGSDRGYIAFHAPRFAYLLAVLERQGVNAQSRVLDIGRSRLTELIREKFGCRVDTLGFQADEDDGSQRHYHFDLNDAQRESGWRRDLPKYDYVVMAEVIEHLHTAPQLVLAFIKTLVAPGGTLILQTPNAAAATRRVKLLVGRNPYEMIRVDNTDPGHFREYTVGELRQLTADAGFDMVRCDVRFYFDGRFAHHGAQPRYQPVIGRLKNALFPLLPSFLRLGITMVVRLR
jgi:SAM-dependent methyltransferase